MAERTGNGTVYELSGPEEAPVVVPIHGLGLNRHIWQWGEPALPARYRVLRYDLFGHGDCAIVGFSLGGMINRRFAQDHPDRSRGADDYRVASSPHGAGRGAVTVHRASTAVPG